MTLDCTCNRLTEAERKAEKLWAALMEAGSEVEAHKLDCPYGHYHVEPRDCDADCNDDINYAECWALYFLMKQGEA